MRVRVYVVCMHVCVYACMCACVCAACVCVCVHVCVCVQVQDIVLFLRIQGCFPSPKKRAHAYIYLVSYVFITFYEMCVHLLN